MATSLASQDGAMGGTPRSVDVASQRRVAGRNTDDTLQVYVLELADNLCLPNQGVRIEKAVDWSELCQRLFPVRDEMVVRTFTRRVR